MSETRVPLPGLVKVGTVPYRVRVVPGMVGEEGQPLLGEHDYMTLELRVCEETPPALRPHVLLHEILHACFDFCGLRSEQEENIVWGLSHTLLMVLRDNPDLALYLLMGDGGLEDGSENESGEHAA